MLCIMSLGGGCNSLENGAHMLASVTALTCHVTAVMGPSVAAQTAVSQEPELPVAPGGDDGTTRSHDH